MRPAALSPEAYRVAGQVTTTENMAVMVSVKPPLIAASLSPSSWRSRETTGGVEPGSSVS
jgi:hypothetical protein